MLNYIRFSALRAGARPNITRAQRTTLRSADQARDRQAWREAATFYRRFLNEVPTDAPIWTQLGHALKEFGHLSDAEAAYRTGLAFAPQDAELYLQLGHVLKLQGRFVEAERAYLKSSALDATLGAEAEIAWRNNSTAEPSHSPTEGPTEYTASASSLSADPATLEQLGDSARDIRDWDEAARQYRAFLDMVPDHGGVWVQYGHALRDQGDLFGGERAYSTAIEIDPRDADAYFQLGHVLFLQGKKQKAFERFRQSFEICATRVTVLGARADGYRVEYDDIPLSAVEQGRTYLEITDLIATMREYSTISGIQRVQLGLIKHVISNDVNCVVAFWESGLLWSIEAESLRQAVDLYNAPVGMSRRRELVDRALRSAAPTRPGPKDTFVITGAIWMRQDAASDHEKVKRAGTRVGAYIYDFIPLTNPEYCHPYLTERFSNTISELLLQLDFAFSISDFVASEFRRLREQAGYPHVPIEAVKLAHELNAGELEAEPAWVESIAALRGTEFVLCVGSLAAHKNHIFALQVWRLLIERQIDPPILVLAGKIGYGVEDLITQLKTSRHLNGRVKIIEGLNDEALTTLYQSCLFTLFPSFVEGWGLPVGESLAHGKVCLASNTTSIPEVGGSFVSVIDPYNARGAADLVATLLTDRTELHRLEARIKSSFKVRTWDDFGSAFMEAINRAGHLPGGASLQLSPLQVLQPRTAQTTWPHRLGLPPFEKFKLEAFSRAALTTGWFPGEDWGQWMDGSDATISLPTDQAPGTLVRVVLQCRSVFWPRRNQLTVTASDGEARSVPVPMGQQDFVVQLDCAVAQSGRIELKLTLSGVVSTTEGESRPLGIGLRRLLYLVLDKQAECVPPGVLIQPTALLGSTGTETPAHGRDALIEAARRQAVLAQGWLRPEAWGTWMDGRTAQLTFRPDALSQERLRVVLRVRSSAPHGGSLTAQAEGAPASVTVLPSGEAWNVLASVMGQVGRDGRISVKLAVSPGGARVGVSAVAWCSSQDAPNRLAAMETVLFGSSEREVNDAELLSRDTGFIVTGHLMGSYSLASVNRRLALALDDVLPGQVRVLQVEGQPRDELEGLTGADHARLSELTYRGPIGNGPQVVISQHWPVWQPRLPNDLALAYVFWEESVVPREMIHTLNTGFRSVLVPTRSVRKALIDSGLRIPVRVIGFAPNLEPFDDLAKARSVSPPGTVSHQRPFTFLHVSSCFPRKGVDVLIAAYAKAFTSRDPVRLVVKGFPNPHNDVADQLARLRAADADLAEIQLIDMDLPANALLDLYREADVVVLPTRGEGFNIPAAEAMAAGIPLIVTAFGGQADFTAGVARWVDYRFTHSRSHLRTSNSVWAEPDVEDLCIALRDSVHAPYLGNGAAMNAKVLLGRQRAEQVGDSALWARRIHSVAAELLAAAETPRPKVAWISTWKIRCGIGEYSRMLLETYPDAFRDVTVLCDTRTEDADLTGLGPLAKKAWRRIDPSSIDDLAEAIQQVGAPVVVVQHHHALIRWGDLATLLEDERVRRRCIVVTMHNTQELLDADPMAQQRLIAALGSVSRVLVHTVADLNLLKREGLVDNVAMFPHGAMTGEMEARPTRTLLPDNDVRLGSYGFFLPHKGFDRLIEAFAIIRRTYSRATLTLVTAEYPTSESATEIARCRVLARSLGVDDAIRWHLEYLPTETSLQLLNDCDLLVLPYQHTPESSSAAVRSALAARVPVVVTPLLIFEELQDAVLRLHGTDVEAIAGGVAWAIQQEDTRRTLIKSSTDWLNENSWANVSYRLSGLLHGLLASEEI